MTIMSELVETDLTSAKNEKINLLLFENSFNRNNKYRALAPS